MYIRVVQKDKSVGNLILVVVDTKVDVKKKPHAKFQLNRLTFRGPSRPKQEKTQIFDYEPQKEGFKIVAPRSSTAKNIQNFTNFKNKFIYGQKKCANSSYWTQSALASGAL